MSAKPKTYSVVVTRTSFASVRFEIQASSEDEAIEKSLEKAYDHEFNSYGADYEVSHIERKTEVN